MQCKTTAALLKFGGIKTAQNGHGDDGVEELVAGWDGASYKRRESKRLRRRVWITVRVRGTGWDHHAGLLVVIVQGVI
jgi:hypothetical protein